MDTIRITASQIIDEVTDYMAERMKERKLPKRTAMTKTGSRSIRSSRILPAGIFFHGDGYVKKRPGNQT